MGRKEDRAARFTVRRATATEAQNTRRFIQEAMVNRISWVAARTLLSRVREEAQGHRDAHGEGRVISVSLLSAIEGFLERHPEPSVKPAQAFEQGPET